MYTVYPVHAFDDNAVYRRMLLTGVLKYHALLDAEKLRRSLTELPQIDDWKKLRGRWRLNDRDELYIVVPPPGERAIRFKHTVFDTSDSEHPLVSQLAKETFRSKTQQAAAGIDGIEGVLLPQGWPKTLAECADPSRDEPILGLHVLSFKNATIVVLRVFHLLTDATGIGALLTAWAAVLAGDHDKVLPLGGVCKDPLEAPRTTDNENVEFSLAKQKADLNFTAMSSQGQDPDWDISSPETGWKMLSLSKRVVTSLVREARDSTPTVGGERAFVSEDDVVTAWYTRTLASVLPAKRAVNAYRLYDIRTRLSVYKPDLAYVTNATGMVWTLSPSAGELARCPLGQLAAKFRASLVQQTVPQQIVASFRYREEANWPLYGDPSGVFVMANSWHKAKMYQVADFSPAALPDEARGECGAPARPYMVDFDVAFGGPPPGPTLIWSGVDDLGTRHGMVYLSNTMWPAVEAELQRLG